MTEYLNIILVIFGVIQGITSAFMLPEDSAKDKKEIEEAKESFQMMGMNSYKQQKDLLVRTFQFGTMLTFLFSVPVFFYFLNQNLQIGLITSGVLLLLDIVKTKRSYSSIQNSKNLENFLSKKNSNKLIHFSRLAIKAVVIAILLSKGV